MKVLFGLPRLQRRVSLGKMVSLMLSRTKSYRVRIGILAAIWTAGSLVALTQTLSQGSGEKDFKQALVAGKETFASTCANCHGLDGRGGEHAPDIAERPRVQQLSDAELFKIIENGIPGAGMPAFRSLEASNIRAVVTYLRTLQGTGKPVTLPGDPARGEAIFFGKAGCSGCPMVSGKGGFIPSDLSAYARAHTVA